MSRLRCGRNADSDGRDLRSAGLVQHARPHHSTAPMEQGERCRPCSSMRAYQQGAVTSNEVTGQSGQSKLHTVGEHRPGGPCDRRTGRLERTSGLQLHCSTTGPGAAWLGTGGEAGPGTDVEPASAAAAGGPCWEQPTLS